MKNKVVVGIDVSKDKLDAALPDRASTKCERLRTMTCIRVWQLRQIGDVWG